MSALEKSLLSRAEARSLTDEVKRDVGALRAKLLVLYEGDAHIALGKSSWKQYWEDEFESHWVTGYRELEAARVDRVISPRANAKALPERHARELVPLLDEPEKLREAWSEIVELHSEEPTAAQVREVVQRHTAPAAPKKPAATPRVVVALKELYAAVQATPIEEVAAWEGNARKLAGEWASSQSYITDLFAMTNVAIPEVVKGELDG